jgi:ABC-2 type transport system ATP-binding protein
VLGHVGEQLADREVGGRLDGGGRPSWQPAGYQDPERAVQGGRADRAGKSTLLSLAVGLTRPTAGTLSVLGGEPAGSPDALDRIAFVAQDAPLYKNLPVGAMLGIARNLNKRWDQRRAEDRLVRLEIPLSQRVAALSGGQKAQLALTIALARRPALLVLDEPFSALDPVARDDFLASVAGAARDEGISVVLSSHVLAELERVATYLVVLGRGEVRVAGPVKELIASHGAGLEEIALRHLRAGVSSSVRTEAAE